MKKSLDFSSQASRTILLFLLAFSLLLLVLPPAFVKAELKNPVLISDNPNVRTCPPEYNLIPNGDVESGEGFWNEFYAWGWGNPWPRRTNEDSHSGEYSVKIFGISWNTNGNGAQIFLEPDTDYTFSFWYKGVKGEEDNATFIYKFRFEDPYNPFDPEKPFHDDDEQPDLINLTEERYYSLDSQWRQVAISFNSGSSEFFTWYFWLNSANGNSHIFFDDACLFKSNQMPEILEENVAASTSLPEHSLIPNGDAENGDTFWNTFHGFPWGSEDWPNLTTEDFHSPSHSLKWMGDSWAPSGGFSPIPLEPFTDYTFSFWYKAVDGGGANFSYSLKFDGITIGGDRTYETDGQWRQVALSFNSGTLTGFQMHNWLKSDDKSSCLYLDDMFLFKTQDALPHYEDQADFPDGISLQRSGTGFTVSISGYNSKHLYQIWKYEKTKSDLFGEKGSDNYHWTLGKGYTAAENFDDIGQETISTSIGPIETGGDYNYTVAVKILDQYGIFIGQFKDTWTAKDIGEAVISKVLVDGEFADDRAMVREITAGAQVEFEVSGNDIDNLVYSGHVLGFKDAILQVDPLQANKLIWDISNLLPGNYTVTINASGPSNTDSRDISFRLYTFSGETYASLSGLDLVSNSDNQGLHLEITPKDFEGHTFRYTLGEPWRSSFATGISGGSSLETTIPADQFGIFQLTGYVYRQGVLSADDGKILTVKKSREASTSLTVEVTGGEDFVNHSASLKKSVTGQEVIISANSVNIPNPRYSFWRRDANGWVLVKDYDDGQLSWVPHRVGDYSIQVRVKDEDGKTYEEVINLEFEIRGSGQLAQVDAITLSVSEDTQARVPNILTAYVTNAESEDLLYKYIISNDFIYYKETAYSADPSYMWVPGKPGEYRVNVLVKSADSFGKYDRLESFTVNVAQADYLLELPPYELPDDGVEYDFSPLPLNQPMNFITRSGDKLMDGNKELRFISANMPSALYSSAWEQEDLIKTVAQMGGQVIRTHTFSVNTAVERDDAATGKYILGIGNYNEDAFKKMDNLLYLCNKYGVRLIVPFIDPYGYNGGIPALNDLFGKEIKGEGNLISNAALFYSDPAIKAEFFSFVSYVLNRKNTITGIDYKDDPAILAWESGNELPYYDDASPYYNNWMKDLGNLIKGIDTNHLIKDGSSFGRRDAAKSDPNIDIVTLHIYPHTMADSLTDDAKVFMNFFKGHKVVTIGEFGFFPVSEVEELYDEVIRKNEIAGTMFWSIRQHLEEGSFLRHKENETYRSYHWPGFSSGDSFQEKELLRLTYLKAFEIQGKNPRIIPGPEVPEFILPIANPQQSILWRGSTGAYGYDIQRAVSPEGPWTTIGVDVEDDYSNSPVFLFADSYPGAIEGKTYYYRIRAKSLGGFSDWSAPVAAKAKKTT